MSKNIEITLEELAIFLMKEDIETFVKTLTKGRKKNLVRTIYLLDNEEAEIVIRRIEEMEGEGNDKIKILDALYKICLEFLPLEEVEKIPLIERLDKDLNFIVSFTELQDSFELKEKNIKEENKKTILTSYSHKKNIGIFFEDAISFYDQENNDNNNGT